MDTRGVVSTPHGLSETHSYPVYGRGHHAPLTPASRMDAQTEPVTKMKTPDKVDAEIEAGLDLAEKIIRFCETETERNVAEAAIGLLTAYTVFMTGIGVPLPGIIEGVLVTHNQITGGEAELRAVNMADQDQRDLFAAELRGSGSSTRDSGDNVLDFANFRSMQRKPGDFIN